MITRSRSYSSPGPRRVRKQCRKQVSKDNVIPSYHSGYFCHCASCRNFHNMFVKDIDVMGKVRSAVKSKPASRQSGETFVSSFKQLQFNAQPKWIKIGDRVTAKGRYSGVVKYIGPIDDQVVSPAMYVGIQLDEAVGLHCGIIRGKRYFETPKGRGMMVKYEEVSKHKPAEKCPPVHGNKMHPSYEPGKYAKLWANSDVGSPVNQTVEWKKECEKPAAKKKLTPEESSQRALKSWGKAKRRISLLMKLDDKGALRNRPEHLPPKLLQSISSWKKDQGGDARADQMAETLKKLHIAQEKGRREIEEAKEKEEKEKARQERERKRLEALGQS